jgi:PhoH-like ATPase
MRVKARALGLAAEDYFNDKTLEDGDLLYTGVLPLPPTSGSATARPWRAGSRAATPSTASAARWCRRCWSTSSSTSRRPAPRRCTPGHRDHRQDRGAEDAADYTHTKNAVWGVTARNREQNFALNLLMDPECDFVTLTGTAGTGKTLMTLAAGLSPGARRPPLHRDHRHPRDRAGGRGHRLPARHRGREDGPWMGALDDNLEVLARSDGAAPANGAVPPPTTWCAARSRSRA